MPPPWGQAFSKWFDYLFCFCHLIQFQGKYCKWAKTVNFTLKLPGDVKKCKEAAEQATQTLDQDLVEKKPSAHVISYSDKLFHRAFIEWLVATDQVNNLVLFSLMTISTAYIHLFAARISSSTPKISRNDWCCILCIKKHNNSGMKGNTSRDHAHV